MQRYVILYMPEGRRAEYVYESRMGFAAQALSYKNDIEAGWPVVLHFPTERERDTILNMLCAEFPGKKFAALNVIKIGQAAAGPVKMYTIDERGMLPLE